MNKLELTINQGAPFAFVLRIGGNFSLWNPRGQIRRNARHSEILASWAFQPATYDAQTQKTSFYPYLSAATTAGLPVPGRDGRWQTDIEIFDPANPESIIKILPLSEIIVVPEVTR